jgi:ssDNA thymidine ADP-ribosyltransferase DarT-like protein
MDPRVTELHCIMPIGNVPSVLEHGLLSYEGAARLPHHSVAMQPVQERRDKKTVPGGLKLHQYANLYFHARNPMLYKRLAEAENLCVLRVALGVLAVPGAVITDRNAASDYVRFYAPSQWRLLDWDAIFAADWRHPGNQVAYLRHRSRKCAEVLIPHRVEPGLITGAYLVDSAAAARLGAVGCALTVTVDPALFFR